MSIFKFLGFKSSPKKNYKLKSSEIKQLISPMGGGIATDAITVEGKKIKFMYRYAPNNNLDSGWQFFSGTETQEYLDNPKNSGVYDVNTIANYDAAIIPYLHLPFGTELERVDGTDTFRVIPG